MKRVVRLLSRRASSTHTFVATHQPEKPKIRSKSKDKSLEPAPLASLKVRDKSLEPAPLDSLKEKANLFLTNLLQLWMLTPVGEHNNFLPHYQVDKTPPETIDQQWQQTIAKLFHELVSSQREWWENDPDLFFNDILGVGLRILLTPNQLITGVFNSIFETRGQQSDAFLNYFQKKLSLLQSNFEKSLSGKQSADWVSFKKRNGKRYYDDYLSELSNFYLYTRQKLSYMSYYKNLIESLFSQAIIVKIPDLLEENTLDFICFFEISETFLQLLGYLLNRIKIYDHKLQADSTYFLWDVLEQIGMTLQNKGLRLCCKEYPDRFYYLLFTSILFEKNYIATFLFEQLPRLVSISSKDKWITENHPDWAGHSLLYLALQTNPVFAKYLRLRGEVLLSDECDSSLSQPLEIVDTPKSEMFFGLFSTGRPESEEPMTLRPRSNAFSFSLG